MAKSHHDKVAVISVAASGIGQAFAQRIIRRLSDLLPVVRRCVYHPKFDFRSSIKVAAPALSPDVTYDDLEEIADGNAASTAFLLMASGRTER